MHKSLISILKYVDVRVIYIFAYIFVVPFCLIFNHSYGVIYRYFRQRHGYSPLRSFFKTYSNHCIFSETVIDKFAMYAGKSFDIKIDGYNYFGRLVKGRSGFIQLSSHIGNYEIAGYTLISSDKRINALVFADEKQSVMENRTKQFETTHVRMIPIREDMSHLFILNEALSNNEIVSMPADRSVGSQKSVKVDFLGAPASFPMGPFAMAVAKDVSVISVNVMKTAKRQYTIFVRPIEYGDSNTREEKIEQLARNYATDLEERVKAFPTQWFNYFDFWS